LAGRFAALTAKSIALKEARAKSNVLEVPLLTGDLCGRFAVAICH
jgi:hypothetical protein